MNQKGKIRGLDYLAYRCKKESELIIRPETELSVSGFLFSLMVIIYRKLQ